VLYAELPAGAHRFEVRAMNSDGAMSLESASLAFHVVPPFWRRWWFLALCVAAIAAVAWALHMVDVRRRLEVQSVRMRIARDLHDQVGTGLSQIAILSEVAQRAPDKAPVSQIAEISRELVDSISDIVWAINPARDNLPDLAQRMHRFAADLLTARNVAVEFQAEGLCEPASIGPETRRQVYLIYRECLRNAARHSRCSRVKVRLARQDGALLLEVADDGIGFDRNTVTQGTGLASLEERARAVGGRIEWLNGSGTAVTLRVPLPV
jgi:signal transduction histidine kinase